MKASKSRMTSAGHILHRAYAAAAALLALAGAASSATAAGDAAAPPKPQSSRVALAGKAGGETNRTAIRVGKEFLVASLPVATNDTASIQLPSASASAAPAPAPSGHAKKGKEQASAAPAAIPGTVVAADTGSGLAVIKTDSAALDAAGLPIFRLAKGAPAFADPLKLETPTGEELRASLQSGKRFLLFARDAVQITGAKPVQGGALVNDCGELAGFASDSAADHTQAYLPAEIARLLEKANAGAASSAEACVPRGDDGLARLIAEARASEASARQRASEADQAIAAIQQNIASGKPGEGGEAGARQRMADLKRTADEARNAATSAEASIAAIEDYRSDHKRDTIIAIAVAVLVCLLAAAAAYLLLRNRKQIQDREKSIAVIAAKTARVEETLKSRGWHDVVLKGPSGVLKVSGSKLADNGEGAIIGRSRADSDIPFGPEDVSRTHMRLFVRNDRLWIEDLESSRGTFVNGRPVDPKSPVSLSDGDDVRIASHEFELRIL